MHPLLKLILCAIITFTGCKKSPHTQGPQIDYALRTFMGVRTYHCPFILPKNTAAYYPVVIFFTDGKEVHRVKHTLTGVDTKAPFVGDIQLLWQSESHLFQRATLINGSFSAELSNEFSHWQEFRSSGWQSVPLNAGATYQNISILGFLSAGNAPSGLLYDAFLEKKPHLAKHAIAVGIVYGDDFDAVRAEFSSKPKQPQ